MLRKLQHRHLVKLVATCQIRDSYALLFPWASGGNLSDFWVSKNEERTPAFCLWSFRQILGLAGALRALHAQNCRHGDLKPENILYFKENDYLGISKGGDLVIADVGVSRIHKDLTMDREVAHVETNTHATTPSYEAPEAQFNPTKARSRRYDMWSIGCILLEFAIWLLYKLDKVNEFHKWRGASRCDPITPSASFYDRPKGETVEVHPAVRKAMKRLKDDPRCKDGTALGDLLELIEADLLIVDKNQRSYAPELYNKLERIVQGAEENPSCILGTSTSTSINPPLFTD